MAKKRLSMTKILEILRLRFGEGLSLRDVSRSISCSPSKVWEVSIRAKHLGLTWPLDPSIEPSEIESMIYPCGKNKFSKKITPDFSEIYKEMRRKGVTLFLLWQEFREKHPEDGCNYSHFCNLYKEYCKTLSFEYRQTH